MMDADHLAALNRGYRKRDFTGWHDCGYRGYALDCGGFSVVYDEGEYFVRVRNNRIDVCARIGYISVEEREVIIEGDVPVRDQRAGEAPRHGGGSPQEAVRQSRLHVLQ